MKPSSVSEQLMQRFARESYHTTRQFADRDRRYEKHCGPTAITNLVLTLRPDLADEAATVFDEVARIGRRSGIYWNLHATRHIGGTSDALAGLYMRRVLHHFDLAEARVRFSGPALADAVRRALTAEKDQRTQRVVYLAMHFHPKYHNHHLLIYGLDWQGFRAADGWQAKPVWLGERDLRGAVFYTIEA